MGKLTSARKGAHKIGYHREWAEAEVYKCLILLVELTRVERATS
jgi:hypothetical protein